MSTEAVRAAPTTVRAEPVEAQSTLAPFDRLRANGVGIPFVVSLSNHERNAGGWHRGWPFDKLRANGVGWPFDRLRANGVGWPFDRLRANGVGCTTGLRAKGVVAGWMDSLYPRPVRYHAGAALRGPVVLTGSDLGGVHRA